MAWIVAIVSLTSAWARTALPSSLPMSIVTVPSPLLAMPKVRVLPVTLSVTVIRFSPFCWVMEIQ